MRSPRQRRLARERLEIDLLSLASHQLRTPLSGIKWLIETMQVGRLGPLSQRQQAYLGRIHEITDQMIRLVFEMLNVLRLESSTVRSRSEVVSLPTVFADIATVVEPEMNRRGVRLEIVPAPSAPLSLRTDSEILKTILQCFLTNAADYSKPGKKVRLTVLDKGSTVVFSVQDFGIGIPQDEQARIFKRFSRGSNAKVHKPDGTGLGLYIAAMLARKIGGKVGFTSREGRGSTFFVRVPKGRAPR